MDADFLYDRDLDELIASVDEQFGYFMDEGHDDSTPYRLAMDVMGHPGESPSREELAYANPSTDPEELERYLAEMHEKGILKTEVLHESERQAGMPYVFYSFTRTGRVAVDLMGDMGVIPNEDQLKRLYGHLEKTDEIQAYEELSRPGE